MAKLGHPAAALVAGIGLSTSAHAVVMTFDGNICDTVSTVCGLGSQISQSYGDIAGQLDVSYDNNLAVTVGDPDMFRWASDYSGLENVAYGDGGATVEIFLQPLSGWKIAGLGFDLGAHPNVNRFSQVTVLDAGGGPALLDTGLITIPGAAPSHFTVAGESASGFRIQFGPDAFNVGIDNIAFDLVASDVTPIPEPATWALMILGLTGAGAALRRHRSALARA